MDNDKTNGERQVCARQTNSVEGTASDREVNVETPTATTTAITAATETATMAAPATEAATMATTTTTSAVAPTIGKKCISGETTTSAAKTVPAAAGHIYASAVTKWIPEAAVGATNRSMKGRGDRKIWE